MTKELDKKVLDKISGGTTLDGQTLTELDEWYIQNESLLIFRAMNLGLEKEFAEFLKELSNMPDQLNTYSSVEEFKKALKDKIGMDCDDI